MHDVARKGLDRLEQLKKWKLERERKKKMDIADNRNINPVFRVSTAVVREDTRLFGKTIVKVSFVFANSMYVKCHASVIL